MSEPIRPGDLVVCVRVCCKKQEPHLGKIRRVVLVQRSKSECNHCGLRDTGLHALGSDSICGSPIWWCKRIPPLGELEGEKRKEELTA